MMGVVVGRKILIAVVPLLQIRKSFSVIEVELG